MLPAASGIRCVVAAASTLAAAVDRANAVAVERLLSAEPVWTEVRLAGEVIPTLGPGVLLHSGPPIGWGDMPGCTKGAVAAVTIFEGWASNTNEAEALAARGELTFVPGHTVGCVAPIAGIVGPSMPVLVVRDARHGTTAFSPLNEGRGRVVRYGACDAENIEHLNWQRRELMPLFQRALDQAGGLELSEPMAESLHMGDELHNRNKAFTRNILTLLALELVRAEVVGPSVARALQFIAHTDIFFLNLSMAACKAALRAIEDIPWCSLVSVMTQNGHRFAAQIAGLAGTWFATPAPMIKGQYFEAWSEKDACPAIGDSIITEAAGLGAFALAAAPALVQYIGGTPEAATALNQEMYAIAVREHPRHTIPALGFRGTPTGIDVRRVVESGCTPLTNAGIAHRDAGVGQIGAGYIRTPAAVFEAAWQALQDAWRTQGTAERDV